ncbi:uncharacterized protein EDB93DRAFT_1104530 [Suillus bovinus]|uniref:uncharacterized protein n=1 Tax=Suillus bovinus TaxID=48563 RepID=UPI001B86267F|nr:uncharacterized protein EDB93DRAFT_1104530 [Suillus bovinus]KAG2146154.1 hypothetical protein EDB93DRAFT_1104530 [Suillus bovinus]
MQRMRPTIFIRSRHYGGELFQHVNAKLRQLDIRIVENDLIPPQDWYSSLRRGTLVMIRATLHALNWKERRVYQLNAHTIRILDESKLEIEPFGTQSSMHPAFKAMSPTFFEMAGFKA